MAGMSPRIVARCRGVSPRSFLLLILSFLPLLPGALRTEGGGVHSFSVINSHKLQLKFLHIARATHSAHFRQGYILHQVSPWMTGTQQLQFISIVDKFMTSNGIQQGLQTFLIEGHKNYCTTVPGQDMLRQCDSLGICCKCFINILFFHYWQNGFKVRMQWLRGPDLARRSYFGDPGIHKLNTATDLYTFVNFVIHIHFLIPGKRLINMHWATCPTKSLFHEPQLRKTFHRIWTYSIPLFSSAVICIRSASCWRSDSGKCFLGTCPASFFFLFLSPVMTHTYVT